MVSPLTASHLALGTPPTQKIVLCFDLSASQKRLKSSAAMTAFGASTRFAPKCEVNSYVRRPVSSERVERRVGGRLLDLDGRHPVLGHAGGDCFAADNSANAVEEQLAGLGRVAAHRQRQPARRRG